MTALRGSTTPPRDAYLALVTGLRWIAEETPVGEIAHTIAVLSLVQAGEQVVGPGAQSPVVSRSWSDVRRVIVDSFISGGPSQRCCQCQTWATPHRLRFNLCCRCVRDYRLSGTWCEAHGPCEPEREGGCIACRRIEDEDIEGRIADEQWMRRGSP